MTEAIEKNKLISMPLFYTVPLLYMKYTNNLNLRPPVYQAKGPTAFPRKAELSM